MTPERDPFADLPHEHGECWTETETGPLLLLANVDSPATVGRKGIRGPGGSRHWFNADLDWTIRLARLNHGSRAGDVVWVASSDDCRHDRGLDILESYGIWFGEVYCSACFSVFVLDGAGYPWAEIIEYLKATREGCGEYWNPQTREWIDGLIADAETPP